MHLVLGLVLLALGNPLTAAAAPRLPAHDGVVVERWPARAVDPAARALDELRQAWRRDPRDSALAVALARAYVAQTGASGDPRFIGYAQAALAPWWNEPAAPVDVRVLRAVLRQFEHRFDDALVDLRSAVHDQPEHAEAWSWIAAIELVRANNAGARQACAALAPLVPPLIGAACAAQVDALSGHASAASQSLRRALAEAPQADPAQRLWALTRLAETEERRGDFEAAELAFRAALAIDLDDVYLLAALADFLLDRNRTAEVLTLLQRRARADVLLLRLAIAAKRLRSPQASTLATELAARFDAARARGDGSHRKEEARFLLEVRDDPRLALPLAAENYAQQREVADARLLLEAALAAREPQAAAPVLRWMAASGVESVALQGLAGRLGAQPGALLGPKR